MDIAIYDGTTKWRNIVPTAVANWNAAFATVGRAITLSYQAIAAASPDYRVAGGVVCSDSLAMNPSQPRQAEGNYEPLEGVWHQGYVHFFWDPADPRNTDLRHPVAVAAHELGHNLMLMHVENLGLSGFTDTVMTAYATLPQPSTWDATNAMPGYPLPNPPPDHKDRHKKKRRKRH